MYRRNVCCFIFNEHVRFLGCVRVDRTFHQCVQGGVEGDDTDIRAAAEREIKEEIGLNPDDLQFVQEILPPHSDPKYFTYELRADAGLRKKGYRGQIQRVLLFYAPAAVIEKVSLIPPKEQEAPQEFSRVDWLTMDELIALCPPEAAHIFRTVGGIAPAIARSYLAARGIAVSGSGARMTQHAHL